MAGKLLLAVVVLVCVLAAPAHAQRLPVAPLPVSLQDVPIACSSYDDGIGGTFTRCGTASASCTEYRTATTLDRSCGVALDDLAVYCGDFANGGATYFDGYQCSVAVGDEVIDVYCAQAGSPGHDEVECYAAGTRCRVSRDTWTGALKSATRCVTRRSHPVPGRRHRTARHVTS